MTIIGQSVILARIQRSQAISTTVLTPAVITSPPSGKNGLAILGYVDMIVFVAPLRAP
jgi:hypothetical protein